MRHITSPDGDRGSILPTGTIGHLISLHAAATPDAAFLQARGRKPLTFRELAEQVADTQSILNQRGIGRGDRLALIVASRAEALALFLGCANAATVMLLNASSPDHELKTALKELRPDAVVVSEELAGAHSVVHELGLTVFNVEPDPKTAGSYWLTGGGTGHAAHPGPARADDIALVAMTSGTTGRSKRIPMSQALVVHRGKSLAEALDLRADDVCMHFCPAHLAAGLNNGLMAPLWRGGSVVAPERFDADDFYNYLTDFGVTWYFGGPAYHEALLARAGPFLDAINTSRLRLVLSTSYALSTQLRERVETTFRVPCYEKYASTEASDISLEPLSPDERKVGTVGLPCDCEISIRDADGRPLPPGVDGQVAVRGPNVFVGYEDDPALTASAFLDGWHLTGDLGRLDDDDFLTLSGRLSELINSGGNKVSPLDVEAALKSHDDVHDCMCFPVPHKTLGQVVGVVVVPRDGALINEASLRNHVRSRLVAHKTPALIVVRDDLPRSPTGKLQRAKAMQDLGLEARDLAPERLATSGRTASLGESPPAPAEHLRSIWRDVLQIDDFGDDEHFVLLGGDSLRAHRLIVSVEQLWNIRLSPDVVYDKGATLKGMSSLIEQATADSLSGFEDSIAAQQTIVPATDPTAPCPLTSTQRRLWLVSKSDEALTRYNCTSIFRLTGRVDGKAMQRAINILIARHQALRACFPHAQGQPYQCFADALEIDLMALDLRELDDAERGVRIEAESSAFGREPFDLDHGPLIRALIIQTREREAHLCLTLHHLIFDGSSRLILANELLEAYRALLSGQEPALAIIPVQFGDYAAWKTARLQGPFLKSLLDFWTRQLEGAPTLIDLPMAPRRSAETNAITRLPLEIPHELATKMREMSASFSVSTFVTALAAFNVLLHRLTGQSDFLVGTGIDERIVGQTDAAIGLFVNTLPLRARCSSDMAFTELLRAVRKTVRGALDHREAPLDAIVEAINPPRLAGRPPLVQVLFNFMPQGREVLECDGLRLERSDNAVEAARFDLMFMLKEDRGGALTGYVEFSDLFDVSMIRQLASSYCTLVSEIVADPTRRIDGFSLLTPAQKAELLAVCGIRSEYPAEASIESLFEDIAAKTSEATAIVQGATHVTYGELDSWAERIAHQLREQLDAVSGPVAISGERSPALIAGLLGILKAGRAYLPLDPALPERRISLMLEDAGVRILLLQEGSLLQAPAGGYRTLPLSSDGAELPEASDRASESLAGGERLAYIMYTSGSTGDPKGVCIPHRGIVRLVRNADYAHFGASERFLQLAPAAFDASTFEIWGCLLNGGALVQAPDIQLGPAELAKVTAEEGVTTLWLTAPLFAQLVDHGLDSLAGVRQVITGGDVLSVPHVIQFINALPECRLVNGYGPTENTTFTCAYHIDNVAQVDPSVPIGRPISNTRVYILDDAGQLAPPGLPGDLYAGGDGIALGYLNRPELTQQKFLPDPFDARPGARMYRTGDRARLLPDGLIQFLGRRDDQVKVRGYRVELGEIEAVLSRHPQVAQAAAIVVGDESGATSLVAFIVARGDATTSMLNQIKSFLGETLPGYMVPSQVYALERLPLTTAGKIDRQALRQLNAKAANVRGPVQPVQPRTPLECLVAEIWCDLLGVKHVGIDEDFFAVGGHSLLAMRVADRIADEVNIDVPVRLIFENPTIRACALKVYDEILADELKLGELL